jgi:hypothetical protein
MTGERGAYGGETGGLAWFGAVLLIVSALFNGLDGIAAIYRSHVFVTGAHYVVGDLRAWGWAILVLGILQLAAGINVIRGGAWGRVFGVLVLGINAFAQMFFVPSYPFWSLTIIAIDIVAIYGLCAGGSRADDV